MKNCVNSIRQKTSISLTTTKRIFKWYILNPDLKVKGINSATGHGGAMENYNWEEIRNHSGSSF